MERVTVRLDQHTLDLLDVLALSYGDDVTRSDLIREAIAYYLTPPSSRKA